MWVWRPLGLQVWIRILWMSRTLIFLKNDYLCIQSQKKNSADCKHGKAILFRNLIGYMILHFPRSCTAMTSAVAANVWPSKHILYQPLLTPTQHSEGRANTCPTSCTPAQTMQPTQLREKYLTCEQVLNSMFHLSHTSCITDPQWYGYSYHADLVKSCVVL